MERSARELRQLCFFVGASLTLLAIFLYLRPEPQHGMSLPKDRIRGGQGGGHPIIEIEGLALGSDFARAFDPEADIDHVGWLLNSLRSRFSAAFPEGGELPAYPLCSLDPERYAKTAFGSLSDKHLHWHSGRSGVVSFAINLHNSEAIIPAQAIAIVEAIAYLLQNNKVYVSIYENGSDDRTRPLLSELGTALQAIGVDGLWIHSSNMLSDFSAQDRIVMLSEIRNLALAPLMPYATGDKGTGTLLLMNDVLTCSSDILELVHQQRLQQAGMAFGMDWGTVTRKTRQGERGYLYEDDPRYNPENPPHTKISRFYDTWVGRGISGASVYSWARPGGFSPASDNESWVIDAYSGENRTIHQRWLDGLAFPVYSGWGGMAAFDASLFTHDHLRFRSSIRSGWTGGSAAGALGPWGRLVSSEGYLESDCPGASECEYIARDIWNLHQGRARIVLASQARTTYSLEDWLVMGTCVPVTRREGLDTTDEDAIDWTHVEIPASVECIASRDANGGSIFQWSEDNHRTWLDPLWRPANNTAANATEDSWH